VTAFAGRGEFASVVKAIADDSTQYAIKISRTKFDIMKTAIEKERHTVQVLNYVDQEDSKSIIKLFESFTFKGHICLVYELMDVNLREKLVTIGKGHGISL
jgi:serine/threonine-protein kinase PRP4